VHIKALQFLLDGLRNKRTRFDTAFAPQYMQQVRQRRAHPRHAALAGAWTFARCQMPCHETVCQNFIDRAKRNSLLSHPVREMLDAMEVRPNSCRTITAILQIADISVGAPAQNARSEPVTI
jgi:hypothetical protein